jgi:outer membrane protein TolC
MNTLNSRQAGPALGRIKTLALLLGLLPGLGEAQALDFKQAVDLALGQNPELLVAKAQIEQAEAAVRQAEGNKLPRVNLSLTAVRTNEIGRASCRERVS